MHIPVIGRDLPHYMDKLNCTCATVLHAFGLYIDVVDDANDKDYDCSYMLWKIEWLLDFFVIIVAVRIWNL